MVLLQKAVLSGVEAGERTSSCKRAVKGNLGFGLGRRPLILQHPAEAVPAFLVLTPGVTTMDGQAVGQQQGFGLTICSCTLWSLGISSPPALFLPGSDLLTSSYASPATLNSQVLKEGMLFLGDCKTKWQVSSIVFISFCLRLSKCDNTPSSPAQRSCVRSSASPISVPIRNVTLKNGAFSRGAAISVGTPPQALAFDASGLGIARLS